MPAKRSKAAQADTARPVGQHRRSGRTADALAKFKAAYLTNGHNATQAAIAIGHTPRNAHQRGYELMRKLRATGELQAEAEKVAEEAHIDTVKTLREVSRILYADPARLFDANGVMLPIDLMDEDTRGAIASFELDQDGRPAKVKFWPKIEAASLAMKHLGLFERHNAQKRENLAIQINLVGSAEDVVPKPRDVNVQATLVDPPKRNGHNGNGNGSHA